MATRGVRVISGTARGRRLRVPPGDAVRPTSDRVKEAVFSALDARGLLDGAAVLDLWAGTGALAIEALSRGADRALLVERDPVVARLAAENLAVCGFAEVGRVEARDVVVATAAPPPPAAPFDLVVADPPYDVGAAVIDEVLAALRAPGWLADDATIVVERRASREPFRPGGWRVSWERSFGDTLVAFLEA